MSVAKGYWIARADISDLAAYKAFVAANGPVFATFGGRFLVRGGQFEAKEGRHLSRQVVIEFADFATALACYHSPDYAAAKALRNGAAEIDLVIVEGVAG